jgi:hypothetical protein
VIGYGLVGSVRPPLRERRFSVKLSLHPNGWGQIGATDMMEPEELRRWERLTAAMIRKAGEDDPEAFAAVVNILDAARDQLREAAFVLRCAPNQQRGFSWFDIGQALGVTRQAAQQRFQLSDAERA